jgi:hypothetical protein
MFATRLWSIARCISCTHLIAAAGLVGCSSAPDLPPMASGGVRRDLPSNGGSSNAQACADGAQRSCTKVVGQNGLVLSCYYGTQTCSSGVWSECGEGEVVLQAAAPRRSDRLVESISTHQPCGNENLCDPSCQKYVEVPSAGLTAKFISNAAWQTGDLSSYPSSIRTLLSKPNCETAADCQQDQHCINVATDSTCGSHDKCQSGAAYTSDCVDSCVASICRQNPSCCQTTQSTCGPGELTSPDGTSCYYNNTDELGWDAARSACTSRGAGWQMLCISSTSEQRFIANNTHSESWLGLLRATPNQTGSAFVCSNGETPLADGTTRGQFPWNDAEPNNHSGSENCAEIYGDWGAWNDLNCSRTLPSWCEGPLGSSGWSTACVNAIATVCGATCDATNSGQPAACQQWAPGQTNPNDVGPDLALDAPCAGQIPVCNHGNASAPSGAVIHVLPTTPSQLGSPLPSLASELGSCTTTVPINPGACVMVADCAQYLNDNAELWVTYPAGIVEARVDDNWGYNVPGVACAAPQCLGGAGACFASSTKTYDYQGSCPNADQVPQWSYLTFEASTPAGSSITISAAAAPTKDLLATEPAVPLVRVSRAAGNESCELSGPASSGCPVNIYSALLPSGTESSALLRLTITLNPSSGGTQSPVLNSWRISYSCPSGT